MGVGFERRTPSSWPSCANCSHILIPMVAHDGNPSRVIIKPININTKLIYMKINLYVHFVIYYHTTTGELVVSGVLRYKNTQCQAATDYSLRSVRYRESWTFTGAACSRVPDCDVSLHDSHHDPHVSLRPKDPACGPGGQAWTSR